MKKEFWFSSFGIIDEKIINIKYSIRKLYLVLDRSTYQFQYGIKKNHKHRIKIVVHAFSLNSADIPSACGCLICPFLIRTAQLVQQPAIKGLQAAEC